MVIFVTHFEGVALFEDKGNSPITRNLHGPSFSLLGLKGMETRTRKIHIPDFPGLIQSVKDLFQLGRVFGLNPLFRTIVKEIFQPLMGERLNHEKVVTLKVTFVKGFLAGGIHSGTLALTAIAQNS